MRQKRLEKLDPVENHEGCTKQILLRRKEEYHEMLMRPVTENAVGAKLPVPQFSMPDSGSEKIL